MKNQMQRIETVVQGLEQRGFARVPTQVPLRGRMIPTQEKVVRMRYPHDESILVGVYAYATIIYREINRRLTPLVHHATLDCSAVLAKVDALFEQGQLVKASAQ